MLNKKPIFVSKNDGVAKPLYSISLKSLEFFLHFQSHDVVLNFSDVQILQCVSNFNLLGPVYSKDVSITFKVKYRLVFPLLIVEW